MNISEIMCLSYQFVFSILVNPIFVSALREKQIGRTMIPFLMSLYLYV